MLASDFGRRVLESGLLPAETIKRLLQEINDPSAPAEALAAKLRVQRLLTSWQTKQILSGRDILLVVNNRYRLLDKLGEGGMGAVFLAEDVELDRQVALKIPRPDKVVKNANTLRRFHREATANQRLDHPNIVRSFDVGFADNLHYIAFELVQGEDFTTILNRAGRLSAKCAVDYLTQSADALLCIYRHGVVHRDMKPSNLLVNNDGKVKLLDLGFARLVTPTDEGNGTSKLTATGIMVGTLDYMAPEQAQDTRNADIRSDIYGLGATFYEMLSGQLPFNADNDFDMLMKHVNEPLADIDGLDVRLMAIIRKMMAKDPGDRYQTPADLLEDLRDWQQGKSLDETIQEVAVFKDPGHRHQPRHRRKPASYDFPEWLTETRSMVAAVPAKVKSNISWIKWVGVGIAAFTILIVLWMQMGRATLLIEWPSEDRNNAVVQIDGHAVPVPADGPISYTQYWGDWKVHLDRAGYEPIEATQVLSWGANHRYTPDWIPKPATRRRLEFAHLRDVFRNLSGSGAQLRPDEKLVSWPEWGTASRKFRQQWAGSEEAVAISRLQAAIPNPLDERMVIVDPMIKPPLAEDVPLVVVLRDTRRASESTDPEDPTASKKSQPYRGVDFSPRGNKLAVIDAEGNLAVWEPAVAHEVQTIKPGTTTTVSLSSVAYNPVGGAVAAGSTSGTTYLMNLDTGKVEQSLRAGTVNVRQLSFSPNGRLLATPAPNHCVQIWDLTTGSPSHVMQLSNLTEVTTVCFSPDGQQVAASGISATEKGYPSITIWQLGTGKTVTIAFDAGPGVRDLAYSPDGKLLAAVGTTGQVRAWDLRTGGQDARFATIEPTVRSIRFSPDGLLFVSAHLNGHVSVWDLESRVGRHEFRVTPAGQGIGDIAISPDSRYLAATIGESTVYVFRLRTRENAIESLIQHPLLAPSTADAAPPSK